MGSVNLVVIVESVRSLISKDSDKEFHLPSIIAVSVALGKCNLFMIEGFTLTRVTGVKLILFIYCFSLRQKSSQVRVLWEDHRNDLWINSFGKSSPLIRVSSPSFRQLDYCADSPTRWIQVC